MVRSFDGKRLKEMLRVVVPSSYLDSILTVLHIRLNHPKQSQLKQIFERYFFSPRSDSALSTLYSSCHLCLGLKKFPKELEEYNPTLFPDHPGLFINVDILKRAGQLILVSVDMFSSYATSCFALSEKADDLATAIIQTSTPIRNASAITIRVDKAPGLVKLASKSHPSLSNVGIKLILGDDENKNSNCSVDKAISELEAELVKLSPSGDKIDISTLAQATMLMNTKIRNRGYTAAELHFSRDSHDNKNLILDDFSLKEKQKTLRQQNHPYLAKSRAPNGKPQSVPLLEQGDIVYLKAPGSKHVAKDPHIVTDVDSSNKVSLRKALHTSHNANRFPTIASRTKLVDSKFIFKPRSFLRSRFDINEGRPNVHLALEDTKAGTCLWNPISSELDVDLVPIKTLQCNTVNDLEGDPTYSPDRLSHEPILDQNPSVNSRSDPSSTSYQENDTLFLNGSDLHSDHTPPVVRFNDGQSPFTAEQLLQDRKPQVGDLISYFDSRSGGWLNARIITDLSRRYRDYYNIMYEDGLKDGLRLTPDTRWTFLHWQHQPNGDVEIARDIQVSKDSLNPTAYSNIATSPTLLVNVSGQHLDSSNSAESCEEVEDPLGFDLNRTRTDSLEWDMLGTDFEEPPILSPTSPSQVILSRVSNLNLVLPTPLHLFDHEPVVPPAPVSNFDGRLPLTSSPVTHQRRISRPRRPLPDEAPRARSCTPSFFSRLNPFKKK